MSRLKMFFEFLKFGISKVGKFVWNCKVMKRKFDNNTYVKINRKWYIFEKIAPKAASSRKRFLPLF